MKQQLTSDLVLGLGKLLGFNMDDPLYRDFIKSGSTTVTIVSDGKYITVKEFSENKVEKRIDP